MTLPNQRSGRITIGLIGLLNWKNESQRSPSRWLRSSETSFERFYESSSLGRPRRHRLGEHLAGAGESEQRNLEPCLEHGDGVIVPPCRPFDQPQPLRPHAVPFSPDVTGFPGHPDMKLTLAGAFAYPPNC